MIELIIKMLNTSDFYDANDIIQRAKGKYKIPTNIREAIDNKKRWQKRK